MKQDSKSSLGEISQDTALAMMNLLDKISCYIICSKYELQHAAKDLVKQAEQELSKSKEGGA